MLYCYYTHLGLPTTAIHMSTFFFLAHNLRRTSCEELQTQCTKYNLTALAQLYCLDLARAKIVCPLRGVAQVLDAFPGAHVEYLSWKSGLGVLLRQGAAFLQPWQHAYFK